MRIASLSLVLLLSLMSHQVVAGQGESIVRDANTGKYLITYRNHANGPFLTATLDPATKIDPAIKSTLKLLPNWVVTYRYRISNSKTARQPVGWILIDPVSSILTTSTLTNDTLRKLEPSNQPNTVAEDYGNAMYPMLTPSAEWAGWTIESIKNNKIGLRVGWDSTEESIAPGKSQSGFGVLSNDLPGIMAAEIKGDAELFWTEDEGPQGEIGDELDRLEQSDYVQRSIAVPLIAVPTVFDPAIVVDRIRAHIATWPNFVTTGYNGNVPPDKKIFLIDSALATHFDAEMLAVATAYRANQPQVARDHMEILLDMIRREHKDIDRDDDDEHDNKRAERDSDRKATTQPIRLDRLAARVLDFDLKYVLKRMKKDDEKHESKKH